MRETRLKHKNLGREHLAGTLPDSSGNPALETTPLARTVNDARKIPCVCDTNGARTHTLLRRRTTTVQIQSATPLGFVVATVLLTEFRTIRESDALEEVWVCRSFNEQRLRSPLSSFQLTQFLERFTQSVK
jgi:hypothetical protein